MKKIPTLLVRDGRFVTNTVTPGCEWVLDPAEDFTVTRKWDGTCVILDREDLWWARREVKPGKLPPSGFIEIQFDPATGKRVGWEPANQSGFWRWLVEAKTQVLLLLPGTYELVGPKINGNPEHLDHHQLIRHGNHPVYMKGATVEEVIDSVRQLGEAGIEGVVWHHRAGRSAKLKARDLSG